tara:strand:- start:289 stop:981 length:693 start_codon:yes stop_codon:yes gene_type:complete
MDKSKINMHKRMAMGMKPKKMAMGAMALGALGAMAAKKMMGKKSGSTDKMKSGMGGALAGLAMKKKKQLAMGKMGGGMMKRYKKGGKTENPMKEERFQRTRQAAIAKIIGKENVGDPRKVERPSKQNRVAPVKKTYMGGGVAEAARRVRASEMKKGGLKAVDKEKNPGLAKLPTRVRNKMGYMKKGGKANTRRMNRLEELGRVDAEKARTKKGARNLRSEKRRIVRELKK